MKKSLYICNLRPRLPDKRVHFVSPQSKPTVVSAQKNRHNHNGTVVLSAQNLSKYRLFLSHQCIQ